MTVCHQDGNDVFSAADRAAVEQAAMAAGFDKAGVAAVPQPGSAAEQVQRERFRAWVERGHAGEMGWLARKDADGEMLRSGLHRAVPWVRSVVLCAKVYHADAPYSIEAAPEGTGWIARYAWSGAAAGAEVEGFGTHVPESGHEAPAAVEIAPEEGGAEAEDRSHVLKARHGAPESFAGTSLSPTDYHDVLLRRLRAVEAELRGRFGGAIQTRCYVDTGPVVERHLAQLAGIGWIGKNTCVLDEKLGSWMLLGVVLTSVPLAAEATLEPAADRCGSCTRCIDACPTEALIAPRQMDASRCISYLTIEKKGSVPEELRAGMGRQVFGCDICQEVCPWNRRAPVSADAEMQMRPELVNPPLAWLAGMDGAEFKRAFRGSPLERTGRRRMQRNVAIAMGNSGDVQHLPVLRRWAAGDDTMLAEAASWALGRLEDVA